MKDVAAAPAARRSFLLGARLSGGGVMGWAAVHLWCQRSAEDIRSMVGTGVVLGSQEGAD
ncbi:MAG: hypothetical protein ABS53_07225 [Hydrogenophaga sp. SCN 70-13]|nr:MAG: hypothetical protein ABS53_07225 [Hydrogenophaga sp. SCN 70-13]